VLASSAAISSAARPPSIRWTLKRPASAPCSSACSSSCARDRCAAYARAPRQARRRAGRRAWSAGRRARPAAGFGRSRCGTAPACEPPGRAGVARPSRRSRAVAGMPTTSRRKLPWRSFQTTSASTPSCVSASASQRDCELFPEPSSPDRAIKRRGRRTVAATTTGCQPFEEGKRGRCLPPRRGLPGRGPRARVLREDPLEPGAALRRELPVLPDDPREDQQRVWRTGTRERRQALDRHSGGEQLV
jgi:hypothetical protein